MITYTGVDWVTMTSEKDSAGTEWWEMYCKYRKKRAREGDKEKPFNNGFYAGVGIGNLRWGYSDKIGYMVILMGSDAELYWCSFKPSRHRVTRLDLCVDIRPNPSELLAAKFFIKAGRERRKEYPRLSLFQGGAGGDTLYVGSRHSQQFGRLYDKGVQSDTEKPGILWRAEVEYKKPLAGLMAKELAEETGETRAAAIRDTVFHWFEDREIKIGETWEKENVIEISVEQRITTSTRKLAWLRSQVSPTVSQLVSLGLGREVLKSLLLDEKELMRILATEI